MIIEFANFRCFEGTHRVHFAPGALTLLSGKSGAGKTTLLRTVEWCLFGTRGLLTTVPRVDEPDGDDARDETAESRKGASTWVQLSWEASERLDGLPLSVRRVKGNNKIYVRHGDLELSGESAQKLVIRLFGSLVLWRSSAYIAQKERCALTQLSSKKELLSALEEMAFHGGTGFGGCEDDLQCLTPEVVKARVDAYARECDKRLTAANLALHFEEGTLDQFMRTNPAVAEAVRAGLQSSYDPASHEGARVRVEEVRRAASLAEALLSELSSLREAAAALPDENALTSAARICEERCAAAREIAAAEGSVDQLTTKLEEVRAWIQKNGAPRGAPPKPPTPPRQLVEHFGGERSSYPEELEKPAFPQLHEVCDEELRYAERYEEGFAWFSSHFAEREYTPSGVAEAKAGVAREISRRELIADLELYVDDEGSSENEIAEIRKKLDAFEARDQERRGARQRVDAFEKKFPREWLMIADKFDNAALVDLARQMRDAHAPKASAQEPKDPRATRSETLRRAFTAVRQDMQRLGAQTLDDIANLVLRNEQCIAALEVVTRVHAHEEALRRVQYATPELESELSRKLEELRSAVEEAKSRLEFSDPMPCPCCGADVILAAGRLLPSDGATRDQRQTDVANEIAALNHEIAQVRVRAQKCARDLEERERVTRALEVARGELDTFVEEVRLAAEEAFATPEESAAQWRTAMAEARRVGTAADAFRNFFGAPIENRQSEEEYLTQREVRSLPPRQFEWLCAAQEIRAARAALVDAEARCAELGDVAALRARLVELTNDLAHYRATREKLDALGECEMLSSYPLGEGGLKGLRALQRELVALWVPHRGPPSRSAAHLRTLLDEDRAAREAYESRVLEIHALEVAAKKFNLDITHHAAALRAHEEREVYAARERQLKEQLGAETVRLEGMKAVMKVPRGTRADALIAQCESSREDARAKLARLKQLHESIEAMEERYRKEIPEDVRRDAAAALAQAERELREHDSLRSWEELREEYARLQARAESKRSESTRLEVEIEHAKEIKRHAEALETRMLEQVIEDLNTSLGEICPQLFEPGASVYLTLTKQNATNDNLRTAFEVHLVQGGKDITLNGISGGEGDRVSFALTLALSDLKAFYASPFIMLDECMGSLDQEMREQCIEAIKDYARRRPHKTIIAVDHLTLSGLFDEVKVVEAGRVFRLTNGVLEPELGH